jgi:hypothetical protein
MSPKKKAHSGAGYEVGYGRPPRHSRFRSGQTGNPKGRPRKDNSLSAILERSLHNQVVIRTGGRQKRMSLAEALIHQILADATRGDRHARGLILKLADPRAAMAAKAAHQVNDNEETDHLAPPDQAILDQLIRELREEGLRDAAGEKSASPPPSTATGTTSSPIRTRPRPRSETKS